MDHPHPDVQTAFPLSEAAKKCMDAFNRLTASLESPHEKSDGKLPPSVVKHQRDRFKIWAANLGALQRGRASLDFRLNESSLTKTAVLRFLDQLQQVLLQSDEVVQGLRLPFEKTLESDSEDDADESSISSSSESDARSNELNTRTELGQNTAQVDQILSSLVKLSFRIRGSTSRTAQIDARTMSYKEMVPVEHSEPVDLLSSYETFDRQYVDEVFRQFRREAFERSAAQTSEAAFVDESAPTGEADDCVSYLKETWSKSITNRRRIFAYWRRHARKLAKEEPTTRLRETTIRQPQYLPKASEPERVPEAPVLLQSLAPSQVPSSAIRTMLSGTEATMYRNDDVDLDTGSVVSYASTAFDADGISSELPPPPSVKPGHTEFVCSVCHVLCPARDAKGRRWREHIVRDIQPYMCTYDNCTEADTMYPNKAAWLDHEAKAHRRVWRCFEHKDLFKSQSALIRHFEVSHPNLSEAQIQNMSELAVVSTKDERVFCPYCQSHGPFETTLADHMASHMERMASFAVPKSSGEEDDSTHEGNSGAAQGSRSAASLRSVSLRFSSSQSNHSSAHIPDLEPDDDEIPLEDADASSESKTSSRSNLDCLGPDHDQKSFERYLQEHTPGTCQWFLDSAKYQDWVAVRKKKLVCAGSPGVGKSVLSSVVFRDLQQRCKQIRNAAVVVISGENYGKARDLLDLLRSLLRQLINACKNQSHTPDHWADELWRDSREATSISTLRTVFRELVTKFSRIYLIIDEFDLIFDNDIKAFFGRTSNLKDDALSIFATARHLPDLYRIFQRGSRDKWRIITSNDDIERYFESALKETAQKIPSGKFEHLSAEIRRDMTTYSNGMFLAARNYVKSLSPDGENGVQLDSMLLNSMMDGFYERTINRILSRREADQAFILLELLMRVDRLKVDDFIHLADDNKSDGLFDPDIFRKADAAISSCAGLVFDHGAFIEFSHHTVSTSLSRLRSKWKATAVLKLSQLCIQYLLREKFRGGPSKTDFDWEQMLNSMPCLPLAAGLWGIFVREAWNDDTHDGRVLQGLCKNFFESKENVQVAIQALILTERAPSGPGYSQKYPHSWTGLHLATYFGITQLVKLMLEEANEGAREWLNWADDDSLVLLAAEQGHLFTLQELHRAWDRPGQTFKAGDGDRAISKAARNGHADVVNYLASVGVLLTATPLRLAAENGHMDIVKILLDRGAPVNANAREAQPLHGAVTAGHVEIAQVLIESGADVNYNNGEFLSIAAERGNEAMVELLLAKGIDVNGAGPAAKPALSYAIQTKNIDIMDLLLSNGANPNRTDWYLSPMDYATETGDDDIIRRIKEAKERFNSPDSDQE